MTSWQVVLCNCKVNAIAARYVNAGLDLDGWYVGNISDDSLVVRNLASVELYPRQQV